MKVVIAHDYLLQFGGAERVVEAWSSQLPLSSIHCLAFASERTFELFDSRDVHPTIRNRRVSASIEAFLPLLPVFAHRTEVPSADLALVSTSGWAHQFTYNSPTLAYVHSPARWLYAADDYRRRLNRLKRSGLFVAAPRLRRFDRPAMLAMDIVVANSRVTRDRIKSVYGRDSEIVHPPVRVLTSEMRRPMPALPDEFSLVASRNRGYKNIPLAVGASLLAGLSCVVVGAGSEAYNSPADGVHGIGKVTDEELRWLYRHASVVLGSAHEDFGLTVLEAGLEGTPAAAIPVGGYLETVRPSVSGQLAASEDEADLATAIDDAMQCDPSAVVAWASTFSVDAHMRRLWEIGASLK